MSKKQKTIDHKTYLMALGLFTLAHRHYREGERYLAALAEMLGYDENYAGCISDIMFDERPDFDDALAAEGFIVRKAKKRA